VPYDTTPHLVQVMAEQLSADLRAELPEDEVGRRMSAVGLAALTEEELALPEFTPEIYLRAAGMRALVTVGLSITPAAGTA
jgi:hypothetical protein